MNFNQLIAAEQSVSSVLNENWLVILVGLVFVFLVMGFLILIVWGVGKLMPSMDKLENRYNAWKFGLKEKKRTRKNGKQSVDVSENNCEEVEEVAAVMAAVYAMYDVAEETTGKQVSFRVKKLG